MDPLLTERKHDGGSHERPSTTGVVQHAGCERTPPGRRPVRCMRRCAVAIWRSLAWLAEQYGARVDQLEVLMGCGPRTVQRTVARLRVAGLVRTQRMLVGEPAWVTPTGAGMAECASGFGTCGVPGLGCSRMSRP